MNYKTLSITESRSGGDRGHQTGNQKMISQKMIQIHQHSLLRVKQYCKVLPNQII